MGLGLTLALSPVAAQEGPPPDEVPIAIDESTLYVASATAVLPNILTNDVPPTAICIVVPEACPPELDPVRDPLREAVGDAANLDLSTPVQPVPPDTVSVAYLGGNARYQSAILFQPPAVPAGHEIEQFDLVFQQAQPTFDMNSPSFRRIVLALFETIGTEDPEYFVNGLADALENQALDLSQRVGIEACPLTTPFEPGGAPMAQSEFDIPRDTETGELAIDCVLGSIGTFDPGGEAWRFDLAFAARAWASGDLENHGLLLRPIGSPNLAFGDPDPTTNAQVGLDIGTVAVAMATGVPAVFSPPAAPSNQPPTLAGGTGLDVGDPVGVGAPPVAAPAPPRDDPILAPPPTSSPPQAVQPARSQATNPWWMWLALPAFALGSWLALSGLAAPAVATDVHRSGAMTRLLAQRR